MPHDDDYGSCRGEFWADRWSWVIETQASGQIYTDPSILRDLILKYLIGCEGFCYTVIEFS
jgi:hypothetical protein